MRDIRWLKSVVALTALGLIMATSSAQAANVPAGSTSSSALSYCSPAPQPAASQALPSRSAAGELCSPARPVYATTTGGWRVAGPANAGATLSLVAFVAQAATWEDAGASRPSAGTPSSVAAGWLAAIASQARLTANSAPFGTPKLAWGDAGAARR
jgi:hypothetical protein